jgi:alanyl-tRNA synthetase
MHSNELRQKFRDFFLSRNHTEIPSASLIPDKSDPTVLLTTAGMQPLVPFLMGAEHPKGKRLFDTQKCFRTPDIEEVGDDTHHTFFEMLGNWSLGDYFKEEAIELAYDFFTEVLQFDPGKFGVTIFEGDNDAPRDDEAEEIWLSKGLDKSQIYEFDKKDNFWGPAGKTGPCGPCSEIHIDRGEKYGCGKACGPNCENTLPDGSPCLRFVEMWNLVFMEYNKKEDGSYEKLNQKNVDTGAGFERLVAFLNQKDSAFDTDIFSEIIAKIEELSGKNYQDYKRGFRVVADHARAASFLIADGVIPGNSGREYILKRIIRRAVLHGKKLEIKEGFLPKIAQAVVKKYAKYYPELQERQEHIQTTLDAEEQNFLKTISRGQGILNEILAKNPQTISGQEAFELFDTYGFPLELTEEIAAEQGIKVDQAGFKSAMAAQRERSREGGKKMFERSEDLIEFENLSATEFDRNSSELNAEIIKVKQSAHSTDLFFIALKETPFYAESGGQVADTGTLIIGDKEANVIDVQKNPSGVFIHTVIADFPISENQKVVAKIDEEREQIKRHHSAAHLLHAALRQILGEHVEQAGSEVTATRTRFDFTHPKNLNTQEIRQIEEQIAEYVAGAHPAEIEEMPIEEAQSKGAMALFSDKFEKGQIVRTIKLGPDSFELCGGTHVRNTAEIGALKITSESSIASGVRRIELVASLSAQKLLLDQAERLSQLAEKLKSPLDKLEERIESLINEKKQKESKIKLATEIIANLEAEKFAASASTINNKKVAIIVDYQDSLGIINQVTQKALKTHSNKSDVLVVVSKDGNLAIATHGDVSAKAILAGITKSLGGGGGGSTEFAKGGGIKVKDEEELMEVLKEVI